MKIAKFYHIMLKPVKTSFKIYERPVSTELGIDPVLPLCASLADPNIDLGDDLNLGYGGEL